jgi:polyketide synthase 12
VSPLFSRGRRDAGAGPDCGPLTGEIVPWALSAASEAGLREEARRLSEWLSEHPELDARAVGAALARRGESGPQRAVAIGTDRAELAAALAALAAGEPSAAVVAGRARDAGRVAFLFPGQGSQWVGMGLELLEASAVFRAQLEQCAAALDPHTDWSLLEVLRAPAEDPAWDRVDVVQPVLFALMVALTEVWRSFGVEPDAVIGHSLGDSAAACVAGGMALPDAARVVARWSQGQGAIPYRGLMASVALSAAQLEPRMRPWSSRVEIAGYNAPRWCAVSGDEEAVRELLAQLEAEGVRAREIETNGVAAHGAHLEAVRDRLMADLDPGPVRSSELPFYSGVDGDVLDTATIDAAYWTANTRRPVLLESAVRAALRDGCRSFVEVSPHPVLTVVVEETVEAAEATVVGSLRRGRGGARQLLAALAEAHVQGVDVDWARCFAAEDVAPAELPPPVVDAAGSAAADAGPALAARLAGLPEDGQRQATLDLVAAELAALLDLPGPGSLDTGLAFRELGLESAAATELRNRLARASGLRLPAAVAYDHPTAEALAAHLQALALGRPAAATAMPAAQGGDNTEPIAIVGIGCRYPGGAASPQRLWQLLAEGGDAIGAFPEDRGWGPDPYGPEREGPRVGGFLAEAAEFDAAFFGIAPREALAMDPQQRLLLECAWEALEDAGVDPGSLRGRDAGVFAGVSSQDYGPGLRPQQGPGAEEGAGHRLTGTLTSLISGRIAYTLGLEGPAVSIDTACSSSLVAMHQASAALRGGECSLALAGGVTVMATAGIFAEFAHQHGLAANGRCKSFAAAADGTGFSEGAALLVLERLSDAERNGHQPIALIRGSAVNQDGASNGLSAPNGPAQERVIRQALANARLGPADVDAVEAHGTGTTLGDPIEAQALLATYGQDRGASGEPLLLGSLKSNLGHTQAAAGVGGAIKMALALQHEELPRTLHLDAPTPHVDWEEGAIELLAEPRQWKRAGRPRRAGISSFGISGTNAHLILEEAPAAAPAPAEPGGGGEGLALSAPPLLLSAKSPQALAAAAGRLAAQLEASPQLDLGDVAHSLVGSRAAFAQRAAVTAAGREEAVAALRALAAGRPHPAALGGRAGAGKPAFLFPGQGSQWLGMGRELLAHSPAFAALMAECEQALEPFVEWSLRETIASEDGAWLDRVDVVQPALFATMVSLAGLWRAFGVEPGAVLGHSQGEIAAAVVAGALSLEDGARVSALRSQALAEVAGQGGMASLALPAEDVLGLIAPWGEALGIAAYNGPASTVVSGEAAALEQLLSSCEQRGLRARQIPVDYASHSAAVDAIEGRLLSDLDPIEPRQARVPIYSTLSGEAIDGAALDAGHWHRSLRQPVLFEQATRALLADGFSLFLEASPHPVLTMAVEETAEATAQPEPAVALGSLRRGEGGIDRFAAALAAAHVHGAAIEWGPLLGGGKRVALPTYPFQRQRFWLEASAGLSDASSLGQAATEHGLLGAAIDLVEDGSQVLTGRLSLQSHPWLADHAVAGSPILPGVAFLELALRAGTELGAEQLRELVLEAPLEIPARGAVQLRVSAALAEGGYQLAIHSRPEPEGGAEPAPFDRHASGLLAGGPGPALSFDPLAWPPAGAAPIEVDAAYAELAGLGLDYGPAFQGLEAAWRLGEDVYAEVALAPEQAAEADRFAIHPALLDSALHATLLGASPGDGVPLPFSFAGVAVAAGHPGAPRLRLRLSTADGATRLEAADPSGAPVCSIDSLTMRPIDPARLGSGGRPAPSLLAVAWEQLALPADAEAPAGFEEGAAGAAEIELVRLDAAGSHDPDRASAARTLTAAALGRLQAAIADSSGPRIAFLGEGAVAAAAEESPDPAQAAAWGLVRSAQSENPGRFLLIDTDGSEASEAALAAAVAQTDEPQLALREGLALAPRLRPVAESGAPPALDPDPDRTVLITGGLSGLGAIAARHLAAQGAKRLLLASRRGIEAPGATELVSDLMALGCEVDVAACDVGEREQLAALLAGIPAEHPLGSVFHCAGVLDDGVVGALDEARLARAMAPKADAAWNLHELAGPDLDEFVLYSSVAAPLGNPGQGNYAAANSFLEALAARRRAEGLAASAIAWGLWEPASGMTAGLDGAGRARLARNGVQPLAAERGLALLDRARRGQEAAVCAASFDRAALRRAAADGSLPPLLLGLAGGVRRRAKAPAGAGLGARLAAIPAPERPPLLLGLVREHTAAVLGHAAAGAIDPAASFKDLGLDSLGAVELRNRLSEAVGTRLEATLVFDHPSCEAVAASLLARFEGAAAPTPAAAVVANRGSDEPVAIVGIGCRFPGASSPAQLWELLAAGRDAIGPFPEDRGWRLDGLFDPDPDHAGTSYAREGGFAADATGFDAGFFGISPREALAMDPQQRLLLECAWEALEDAGIDPLALAGTSAGVFAGVMASDYANGGADLLETRLEVYAGTGLSPSVVSGRLAYTLGLEGPAVSVDTACSASLVALHQAAAALRCGECERALAGGVMVMATPRVFVETSRKRGLARDGRSKSFATAADGTGFSEGAGVLVLERLSDAERNGHRPIALIRGSAINQDGASNGLTAPNGPSQERVIRQALANSGLAPADIDAVEAHGTGTQLGDPIEAQALLATYGQERGEGGEPLYLGSLKSNLGHAQAAAGVAGVIKMALALRHEELPRTLHAGEPTAHVDWEAGEVELLTEPRAWKRGERPRRAGVSSFGISGTNVHMILEEAPAPAATASAAAPMPAALPLLLSAKGPAALAAAAERLAARLRADPGLDLRDVAATLAARAGLELRAAVVGAGREELLAGLDALAAGREHPALVRGRAAQRHERVAFLMPGHGPHWLGMATELLRESETFARRMRECDEALAPFVGQSVFTTLESEDAGWFEQVDVVQPALFAVSVSLAALWREFGVEPGAVVGHSLGGIAAAVVAGALSLQDGALVVARRSRALVELEGNGSLVALAAGAERAQELIEPWPSLSLGAYNSPSSSLISGEVELLEQLLAACERAGVRARRVQGAAAASHSHHVEPIEASLLADLAALQPRPATLPLFSTVTGAEIDGATLDARHWYRTLREPVRFEQATRALLEQGFTAFVEPGPHPALGLAVEETAASHPGGAAVFNTLRRGEGGLRRFLLALAGAHVHGVAVDFSPLLAGAGRVDLPTYPFQRRRLWLEAGSYAGSADALDLETAEAPAPGASFVARLAAADAAEREEALLELVREHAAAVLGHGGGAEIDPAASFKDLGFDSAGAVELRNRLSEVTERPLDATLVFDYPSCEALADWLAGALFAAPGAVAAADEGGAPEAEPSAAESEIDAMDLDSLVRRSLKGAGSAGGRE